MHISLHPGQLTVFQDQHKIRVAVMGRRFGKSRLVTWELILSVLGFKGQVDPYSPQVVLGVMPTLPMAKSILWKPLLEICTQTEVARAVKSINRTENRIQFLGGKPDLYVTGADNIDRLRGKRIYFAACDEMQDCKPGLLDAALLPAMADTRGSRALLTGTPKGRQNQLYTLFQRATTDPETYKSFNLPTTSNPFILREEIERARRTMPPTLFEQEFHASFVNFSGQWYTELDEGNRCDGYPLRDGTTTQDPEVFSRQADFTGIGVDFGDVHPALVVLGMLDGTWYYLDGWQGYTGNPIPGPVFDAELVRLARHYSVRATYCDPSRPSSILAIRALGDQYDLPGLVMAQAGYNRILEGIYQVHSLVYQKRLQIPRRAVVTYPGQVTPDEFYDLMVGYHRETDRDGNVLEKPAEGQPDHILDSLRYLLAVATP